MDNNIRSVEHLIFYWKVKNFSFHLNHKNDFHSSPVFYLRQSKYSWCLKINVSLMCDHTCEIKTRLCRPSIDVDNSNIDVQFSLSLKTVNGHIIAENRHYSVSFLPGSSHSIDVENTCVPVNLILDIDDTLVVTCDMFFVVDERDCSIDLDIEHLSRDILKLFHNRNDTGNSVLLVGEQRTRLNVHKEILCSSSLLFRDFFSGEEIEYEIRNYSVETVESLLEFLYSGNFKNLMNDKNIFELLRCAIEFEVTELICILHPTCIYGTSTFELDSAQYRINFVNFTKELSPYGTIDTGFISLDLKTSKYCIILKSVVCFKVYNRVLQTEFNTKMWNLTEVDSFVMEMTVCDDYENILFKTIDQIMPSFDGRCSLSASIEDELLFGNESLHGYLHVDFKFKFKLKDSIIVSGLKPFTHSQLRNKLCLSNQMKEFFKFPSNTDIKLIPTENENVVHLAENEHNVMYLHKSILSVRFPEILASLTADNEIILPLTLKQTENLMFYIYTGCVETKSYRSLVEIYEAAKKVFFTPLTNKCLQLIVKSITSGNMSEI